MRYSKGVDPSKEFCVYLIVNSSEILAPFYIGQTSTSKFLGDYFGSVASRKWRKLYNEELSKDSSRFRKKVLYTFDSKKEAIDKETEILKHFDAHKSRLFINMNIGGSEFFGGPKDENVRKRISAALRGRKLTKEHVVAATKHLTGSKRSEETKRKISEGNKLAVTDELRALRREIGGRPKSEETRLKIAASQKARIARKLASGEIIVSPMKGKKHSEETKAKMSKPKRRINK
ncbi:homing endonuclease [Agrobacterium phage OLIVR5]|uniref:Homing endonuclease n=1 Tax=Agrobacterium phage OLIVR5 TaxID=2723773 RepID=A0A858MSW6_9CAUD|nr:HNH endonuclease [Agrobacterium phage OLIVR5]QIW87864.1 homing endonuclease [Agrobacterium phage OLIVR5]QIW88129.1 homing endonuclease [Agrobacterium phage OLIVR6]